MLMTLFPSLWLALLFLIHKTSQDHVLSTFEKHAQFKRKSSPIKWYVDELGTGLEFGGLSKNPVRIPRALPRSTGEPWPQPQFYDTFALVYRICPNDFRIVVVDKTCDILQQAISRYRKIIFEKTLETAYDNLYHRLRYVANDVDSYGLGTNDYARAGMMTSLSISVTTSCTGYPSEDMDESLKFVTYSRDICKICQHDLPFGSCASNDFESTDTLMVKADSYVLKAAEVWGALRGLETYSQLVHELHRKMFIRHVLVRDSPRFKIRGILLDSARHFIEKDVIYQVIDGMEQNKMNALHWHLSDDQSFPYQSKTFSKLSHWGSYHPDLVYTPRDVEDIIEYARLRGVRIIPEFDVPARTLSWGMGHPDILTQCYLEKKSSRGQSRGKVPVQGYLGPMDPSKNSTYLMLSRFFSEIFSVFKDKYIHVGGSDVPLHCWDSNPEIEQFRQHLSRTSYKAVTPYDLWQYFISRLLRNLSSIGNKRNEGIQFLVWQDGLNIGVKPPDDAVIHLHRGGRYELQSAVQAGYRVVTSQCWNLGSSHHLQNWKTQYLCDPSENDNHMNESFILGGIAILWADHVTSETTVGTLWPRASVAAERLWSSKNTRDVISAAGRLAEHRCRMLRRGLGVGNINGPDYCLKHKKTYPTVTSDADTLNNLEKVSLLITIVGLFTLCGLMAKNHRSRFRIRCWILRK